MVKYEVGADGPVILPDVDPYLALGEYDFLLPSDSFNPLVYGVNGTFKLFNELFCDFILIDVYVFCLQKL